jgi:predicted O-methyltransferase YrrM
VHFEGEIPNFYQMTTDEFFAQNKEKFDLIFIDASHKFDQVKVDFENSVNALEEMGIIILHDTDPAEEYMTIDKLCSNSYLMNEYLAKNHPEFSFVTLPVSNMGLTICNRFKELRHLKFAKLKSSFSTKTFENKLIRE